MFQTMSKKKRTLFGIIIVSVLVFYSVILLSKNTSAVNEIKISSITTSDLIKRLGEKNDFILFIGRPTCEECQKASKILKKMNLDTEIEIGYWNTDKAREDEEKLDDILTKLDVAAVPAVLKVADGEVERSIIGVGSENEFVKEVSDLVKREE